MPSIRCIWPTDCKFREIPALLIMFTCSLYLCVFNFCFLLKISTHSAKRLTTSHEKETEISFHPSSILTGVSCI